MLSKTKIFKLILLFVFVYFKADAQTTLIDTKFNTTTLDPLLSSDGTINPTKAADGVCSQGMIQINVTGGVSQYLEANLTSCSVFTINMKSTSTTAARTVIVKYKKAGESSFTTLSPGLSVLEAKHYNLTDSFTVLKTTASIVIRLETSLGNTAIHDLTAVSAGLSPAANITSFKMNGQIGDEVINTSAGAITLNVLTGTSLSNVAPSSVGISNFASISPSLTTTRNFSGGTPVSYTVSAENGTTKAWTVVVSQVNSDLKDITDFKLSNSQLGAAVINKTDGTITVNIPDTSAINSLVPYYMYISNSSSINPVITTARNFSAPVNYTVTAQDNSTKTWTVNVNRIDVTGFPVVNFNNVVGFASMTADGFTGPTTGGAAQISGRTNDTVYINGPSEFAKFCKVLQDRIKYKFYNNHPLTIVLESGLYTGDGGAETIWANQMLTIQDQENLTIIGRKNVTLNFGINVKRSYNILIRNIFIQDYYDDGINIGDPLTHHVWVDHCTVGHPTTMPADEEHPDGGIDVKDGASYVTISWTKFRNSWKTSLNGHSDNPVQGLVDAGRLKVTYYANHFYHTNSRNPRVRFGEAHILNNLEELVQLYGIAAANSASVYAENNFFLNTRWAMYADRTSADFKVVFGNNSDNTFTSKTGNYPATGLKQVGNDYDDSGLPIITAQINSAMLNPGGRSVKFDEFNPSSVFTPSSYYSYTPMTPAVVRKIVPLYAGADVIDFFPKARTNVTLPLNLLSFDAKIEDQDNPLVKITWTTTNEVNTKDFEVLRKGDTDNFVKITTQTAENKSGVHQYLFMDRNPLVGANYYQLKQNDNDGKYTSSKIVSVSFKKKIIFQIYPNPTSETLNVLHEKATKAASYKVVGMDGKTLIKNTIQEGSINSVIDVSKLAEGTYILVFTNSNISSSLKFKKQ